MRENTDDGIHAAFRRTLCLPIALMSLFAAVALPAAEFDGLYPYGTNVNTSAFCTTGRVSQVVSVAEGVASLRAYAAVSSVSSSLAEISASRVGFQLFVR